MTATAILCRGKEGRVLQLSVGETYRLEGLEGFEFEISYINAGKKRITMVPKEVPLEDHKAAVDENIRLVKEAAEKKDRWFHRWFGFA